MAHSSETAATAPLAGRLLLLVYAGAAYAVFLGVFVTFILWSVGVGLPVSVDGAPLLFTVPGTALAVGVDLGLIALFGLQHSTMARRGFKARLARVVPQPAERATYVWVSNAALALLVLGWQPLPGIAWQAEGALRVVLLACNAAAWLFAIAATYMVNHFDLFGLEQAWRRFRGRAQASPRFVTRFAYRFVRHPLMTGIVLGLWVVPTMSTGHLLLSAGLTAYIVVGTRIEERDLLRLFGERYRRYRQTVPMLFPRPGASVDPGD